MSKPEDAQRTLSVRIIETGETVKTVDVTGWKETDILSKEVKLRDISGFDCEIVDSGRGE